MAGRRGRRNRRRHQADLVQPAAQASPGAVDLDVDEIHALEPIEDALRVIFRD